MQGADIKIKLQGADIKIKLQGADIKIKLQDADRICFSLLLCTPMIRFLALIANKFIYNVGAQRSRQFVFESEKWWNFKRIVKAMFLISNWGYTFARLFLKNLINSREGEPKYGRGMKIFPLGTVTCNCFGVNILIKNFLVMDWTSLRGYPL